VKKFRPALKPRQTLCRIFGVIVAAGAGGIWFMPHDESNMTGWIARPVVDEAAALDLIRRVAPQAQLGKRQSA
jgi:hypothetical protein